MIVDDARRGDRQRSTSLPLWDDCTMGNSRSSLAESCGQEMAPLRRTDCPGRSLLGTLMSHVTHFAHIYRELICGAAIMVIRV
ncbi:hypothetical protein ElyMa_006174500 [Elysia marginata]|uniref:Uncharacterized protein n=1 Tax=Elysia marginata TaxID=1093978 RepID=A0AAV4H049_9GAST|nr:hypothetical protein ElyMa_006174500 [Elysia marginata]